MNLLFDLDGTLSDPKIGVVKSIQHAMRQIGVPLDPIDPLDWCIGPSLQGS